ncbi:31 kDa ribonucleoprotein [Morus notabilis]|uniref:31 kDa ribonucleoprotein n=1 Tax=Morus notabilis TaxID=981085 RepID=W9QFE1_9ROSA|nr:28 kDa ribonucleoprotein, chloroplastic [Morus notabilis]EXB32996.1 31 kDa ribonucleoprotein [Morus notabilis]
MAALEAVLSLRLCLLYSSSPSSSSSSSLSTTKLSFPRTRTHSLKLHSANSCSFLQSSTRNPWSFRLCFSVQEQEIAVQEKAEETHLEKENNQKRKLYVVNLPWSLTVVDIKSLFGQCGTVTDVEIIKQKDGRNRGFAFVTMACGEEAQAVIDRFNLQDVSGRIIKIELAKQFKKPSPPRPPGPQPGETTHKLYVSNIEWKVRSTHLRDFVSENFKPVSARVVFDGPKGRSAGYGFVSFATREEAEAAISSLDGKELMGRPLRLKFSEKNAGEKNVDETENQKEEETVSEGQTEES